MPAWITLYCRRSVGHVDTKRLRVGILGEDSSALAGIDYETLAEDYGVDGNLVDNAISNLQVTQLGGKGFETLHVSYFDNEARPVVVHRWHHPDRVSEEIDEVIDRLVLSKGALIDRLRESCEVIGIELGWSQLEDMGVVIAYEVARYLAQLGDSLVLNDEDEWRRIDENGAFVSVNGDGRT